MNGGCLLVYLANCQSDWVKVSLFLIPEASTVNSASGNILFPVLMISDGSSITVVRANRLLASSVKSLGWQFRSWKSFQFLGWRRWSFGIIGSWLYLEMRWETNSSIESSSLLSEYELVDMIVDGRWKEEVEGKWLTVEALKRIENYELSIHLRINRERGPETVRKTQTNCFGSYRILR